MKEGRRGREKKVGKEKTLRMETGCMCPSMVRTAK